MTRSIEPRLIAPASAEERTIAENLNVVLENWKLVLGTAAIILFIGITYAVLAPPVYQADALIQVEDPNSNNASNPTPWQTEKSGSTFDPSAATAAEGELVKSRLVLKQTVEALNLDIDATPNYFPVVGHWVARHAKKGRLADPLFGMRIYAWGGEKISVSNFDAVKGAGYKLKVGHNNSYTLYDSDGIAVAQGVVGQLVTGSDQGEPISIKVDQIVAHEGVSFTLRRLYELDAITRLQDALTVEVKGKDAGILSLSLDGEDNEAITKTVNAVALNYVNQNVEHKRQEAQKTLVFLNEQLPKLKSALENAENTYNLFRNKNGTVDLSEESRLLLGQMVDAQARQLDLEQKRTELSQRFSPQFPAVASLTQNIDQLKAQQQQFAGKVSNLPDTEQNALRLLRDVRVNTELYTNMLNSAQQLNIATAGEMGNVRVVDWAMTSIKPVKPKKSLIAGLALILGLAIGVGIPFVRRWLNPGIERSEHFEQFLSAPVYSIVPHSDIQAKIENRLRRGAKGQHLLATQAPDDIAVEAIRSLQTALHFGAFKAANNVILLTGPRPDVGKSFLAANLATVLASGGKRVLLIDADMRGGNINRYFGVSASPGLSDAILGGPVDQIIRRQIATNLDFMPKGSKPGSPAGALMSSRFQAMLEEFSGSYDAVVVDAPPLLAVADAAIIARYAGTTLFAVRYGRHTSAEIVEAERRLLNARVQISGVLLNDVPQRSVKYGAYYGS